MKQFTAVIISIIVLLILAGCKSSGGGSGSDATGSAPKTPFLGGTDGLDIELLEDSPPEEVTDGGTFPFQAVAILKNEGEFDLKRDDVKVDLIGILPEDFGVSSDDLNDKRPEDDLSPKIKDSEGNVQDPIMSEVTFPDADNFFNFEGSVTGNTVFIFRADVCYKYQTKALSRICVLRDLINIDEDDDVCDPTETKKVFSSSSPIQVNSFKQTVTGKNKISFSFDILHSGSGEVFKEGDATSLPANCPKDSRTRREKENKVLVNVETGLPNIRCIGLSDGQGGKSGFITLVNDKRTVTCHQELDFERNDFETNVDITLDFNYRDDVEREVLVKHLID